MHGWLSGYRPRSIPEIKKRMAEDAVSNSSDALKGCDACGKPVGLPCPSTPSFSVCPQSEAVVCTFCAIVTADSSSFYVLCEECNTWDTKGKHIESHALLYEGALLASTCVGTWLSVWECPKVFPPIHAFGTPCGDKCFSEGTKEKGEE